MRDIVRFEIPTPFTVGTINCYLLEGETLTLLDPGPHSNEAYDELSDELAAHGHEVEDVDRILITHEHMDHFGLASRLVAESGAEVVAHRNAVDRLSDPDDFFEREKEFFRPYLLSLGIPDNLIDTITGLPEPYMSFHRPVEVDRGLEGGEHIDVGSGLRVVYTPGHAPGAVCYHAEAEGITFTGDHVLMQITPNPILTLRPDNAEARTRSLPQYLDSLRTLQSPEYGAGYGGHRQDIPDVPARAGEIITHHDERKEVIADMLAEDAPMTPYEIMQNFWPDVPATEMFPAICEIIGHLDLLEDEQRVELTQRDGVTRYALEM